jgi:hypothetical protein
VQHALIGALFAAKVARLGRGLAAGTVLSTALLWPKPTRAQDLHPTLLAYRAPSGCPLVGDFQRSVQRRSARIHFVDEGTHDRELSISLRKEGDFTVGELRLIEQNGTLRQRSVRFTTCEEAVEGLALIATVSLDPQALLQDPQPVPETPPAPAPKPVRAKPPLPIERPPVAPPPRSPPLESSIDTNLGGELMLLVLALPKPALGATLFLDAGSSSRHLFAPLIHVSITHVEQLQRIQAAGDASFTLTLVGLSACPLRIGGNIVVFRPCASASGGGLHTSSSDPTARLRPYASWGGTSMLSVRLGELAEIVGDAGVGVTLIRDTFTFGGCSQSKCPYSATTQPLYISGGLGFRLLLP